MKRSYKLRALGDVASVIKQHGLSGAARKLGVHRSTLHRWMDAGKVKREKPKQGGTSDVEVPDESQSPEDWAMAIREKHDLSDTQEQLLEGAVLMLKMSRDTTAAAGVRIQSLKTFQSLVRDLPAESEGKKQAVPSVPRVARTGTDPRAILMAVK